MGNDLLEIGDAKASTKNFKKAIKINPSYAEAHYNLGIALTKKEEWKAAIKCYTKALEIEPQHAEAQHLLASLLGNTTTTTPQDYVEKLFNGYAQKFDASLI